MQQVREWNAKGMLIKQLAVLANSMTFIPLRKKEVRFCSVLLYTAGTTANFKLVDVSMCFSEIKTSLRLIAAVYPAV